MQQHLSAPRCHPLQIPVVSPTCESSQQEWQSQQLDEVQDVLQTMRRQEAKYFGKAFRRPMPWRSILLNWMFSVVDIFQLAPQIVPTAMYFIDQCSVDPQFLTSIHATTQYQLLGLVCLELAIKVHDTKVFPMEDLVRMGQVSISPAQVIAAESQLLETLGWNLHPPTPHCFVHQFGVLLECLRKSCPYSTGEIAPIVETALLFVRKGLYDVSLPPAIVAYAAMLASMEQYSSGLSTRLKQSFCVHVLQITGLSASSPGLTHAYQIMDKKRSPSLSSSSSSCSSVPTHSQQRHHDRSSPATAALSSYFRNWPNTQPPAVYQQVLAASQRAQTSNHSQSVPVRPINNEAAAVAESATMIYSAGENLGFEVTLNPADNLVDDMAQMSLDKLTLASGLSPRNVSGALSPERH